MSKILAAVSGSRPLAPLEFQVLSAGYFPPCSIVGKDQPERLRLVCTFLIMLVPLQMIVFTPNQNLLAKRGPKWNSMLLLAQEDEFPSTWRRAGPLLVFGRPLKVTGGSRGHSLPLRSVIGEWFKGQCLQREEDGVGFV